MEESEKILEVAEPVEEVAEETTEVVETPQEEDFTEEETTEKNESVVETKEQSLEERAEFASIRRKAEEEANLKLESERQKAFNEGRLEAYKGKINPYTEKPIVDLTDVEMYETMYQLEQTGKDPIRDLPEYMATKRRDEEKAIQEKKELEEKTKKEIDDFNQKYPDVDLNELLKDSFFVDYIQGKTKPIVELYEGFNNFKNAFRNSAVEAAKQTIANSQSSPGSLGNGSDVTIDFNSMSSAEFEKYVQRAKDGELK